jgi:aspartyl-tRNA(Asn)/glutamyl-tRNA(Gln) amidotransferase subunit A
MAGDPADLGVVEAAELLAGRSLSAVELVDACLARIGELDGVHSFDGDPESINAWVRVYAEDARAAAKRADERRRAGSAPFLCGIPIGLKDLYAVAGKPLTASSRVLDETPDRDCDVWRHLSSLGMVLLGHVHTHEFALGGTTDQVGNPWALERSAGGSSGGSAAALAARMVPAATGTDTAGSLRIPSALCGTSTIKPTRGAVSMRGVAPLSVSLDHAGPMARTLADCAVLLAGLTGHDAVPLTPSGGGSPLNGLRLTVSPRVDAEKLDPDVAEGFDAALDACRRLGASIVSPPPPEAPLDLGDDFLDVILGDLSAYHGRFDGSRELYRPFMREWMDLIERRSLSAREYVQAQMRRDETTAAWTDWLAREGISAVAEPTVPVVAPLRGTGYERPFQDAALISLTHYWDWTGFPAVALPAGTGRRSGLPVSVSLIGPAGSEQALLRAGIDLQAELGVPPSPLDELS